MKLVLKQYIPLHRNVGAALSKAGDKTSIGSLPMLIVVLVSTMTLASCNKYLDKQPDNRTTLDNPTKVSQLLTSAYPASDYISFCESLSDNSGDRGYATQGSLDPRINENAYKFIDYPTNSEGSSDSYWLGCYNAIAAANQALDACNKAANPIPYQAYKGEALLARAYAHFMLVSLYAKTYDPATAATDLGIPYVTEPETQLLKKYDRKTVAYVYDMIEKDILAGIPLLDDNAYQVPAFRFTTTAAHAFAARFYLFKKQYDKVVQQADLAFPGNTTINYLRPWNTVYKPLTDLDFRSIYTKSDQKANLLLATTASYWARDWQNFRYGLNSNIANTIVEIPEIVGGSLAIDIGSYGASGQMRGLNKFLENFIYEKGSSQIGNGYIYIPLLSGGEVLFNRAEALVMQGNYDAAVSSLNTYLSTVIGNYDPGKNNLTVAKALAYYKTSSTKDALIKTILDLKRYEYIDEGMRWFDILRYHLPVTHTILDNAGNEVGRYTLTADDPRRVIQIPQISQSQAGLAPNPR
jgi:hypothetical protein